ncbi:MAG: UDP-2,3-diacylglucosamine diphosphatase [Aquabacterium sp.]|nr:UDP-2,3-diacylglucosamine diphosphatase [Aquabacterium sp.]MDO9003179.1 UDP-2,3-diacylglucosamine diphosphatase [Aquabacterium sp.]
MTGDTLPFPAADTLNAPPSWRCIDFVSDLHLHAGLPRTASALARYLQDTPADAVLIMGDLFEAWVGDDMRHAGFEADCTAFLAEAGQRLHLGLMVGNRDFLLGHDMVAACHAHALADPTILTAFGQQVLLTHGDALCLADQAYLRFRAQVRQPAWRDAFLAKPLTDRLMVARQMREASAAHQHQQTPDNWADVDEAAAGAWMQAAHTPVLVHGHTHRPKTAAFGIPGGTRHVLSDWDLDGAHPRCEVLRLSAQGFERVALLPTSTG